MPSKASPLATLYVVVHGGSYEHYAWTFREDALTHFLPGECEYVVLPGRPAPEQLVAPETFSHVSATRYRVALDHLDELRGDYIFQADVDMRILRPVGREILADGLTVTMHPGLYNTPPDDCPFERRPESRAYVPRGKGKTYHPGAFVGGRRAEFLAYAEWVADAIERDIAEGTHAVWYEESYLTRYLVEHPPALVLDERYCWWAHRGENAEARIVHLDKTREEVAHRA